MTDEPTVPIDKNKFQSPKMTAAAVAVAFVVIFALIAWTSTDNDEASLSSNRTPGQWGAQQDPNGRPGGQNWQGMGGDHHDEEWGDGESYDDDSDDDSDEGWSAPPSGGQAPNGGPMTGAS